MHRIDGAGNENNLFVPQDPLTHRPPTEITADYLNAVQEELVNFILWAGLALNKGDNTQLRQALTNSFAHKNSTIHYVKQVWTIVDDTDALDALEDVPAASQVIVTHHDSGFGMATWDGENWSIIPLDVGIFDLYGTDLDHHGYYWFSGIWNQFDVAALQVEDATILQAGIARIATLEDLQQGLGGPLIVTPQLLKIFTRSLIPPGMIFWYTGKTPPDGFFVCGGLLTPRDPYASLWEAAQNSENLWTEAEWTGGKWGGYSTGDGVTNFRTPDLRGEFLRGWDNGRGIDAGRVFGSSQTDAAQKITGAFGIAGDSNFNETATGCFLDNTNVRGAGAGNNGSFATNKEMKFDSSRVVRTAAETRARNVALLPCIKI